MATGPRALVRAGDGTVGTPVAMAGGITLVTPSQAGERRMAASSVESAVTSSISRSLRDAATSWVQSFFSRVTGESGTSSSLPAAAPESDPGPVAAPAVTKESDREVCDDVICVAQRLIMEVRQAAAADGRITPTPKAGKKKLPRRSLLQSAFK